MGWLLMKKFIRLNPFFLTILTVGIGICSYWVGIPFLDLIELKTIDLRFKARGEVAPGPEVVLAVIDEKSINREGKWVWPRSKIAQMIDKLSEAGARVIAFDIGFLEPDNSKVVSAIGNIRKKLDTLNMANPAMESYLQDLAYRSDNDRLLAEAIAASKSRIVLGYFFHMDKGELEHLDTGTMDRQEENAKGSRHKMVRYASAQAQNVPLIEAVMPQSNLEIISKKTPYSGYFNMFPDPDGVVRWIPAVIEFRDHLYAPLSLMSLSAYLDAPLSVKVADYGIEEVNLGKLAVPTDELGRILINYRGREKTFPHISITDILHDEVPKEMLRDKIVMVGATAVGIYDLRVTPFGSVFPGLEIHANMVSSILARNFLHQPAWAGAFDIFMILGVGFFLWFILARRDVITGGVAAVTLFAGYILLCQYLFAQQGWILNLIYPLTVLVFTYVGITAYKYLVEARQKKFIRDAFSTYLAPTVVKQLVDSGENLVLGGEERVITAFFSDVQGFTGISEKLSPAELVELLNEFLTEMTDIILTNEGTVDKFEGDAIIAFFGAPNDLPHQEETAVATCLDMQKRLAQLREKWSAEGRAELKMRIGLCTGRAVVGNMGSKNRMDYTMMGDTVNTAARLEGVNKVYGTYTMISDTTYRGVSPNVVVRELDAINVVGKKEPVTVYEPIGYNGEVDPARVDMIDKYADGLAAYRKRDWNRAIIFFSAALAIDPDDGPSKTLLNRCNGYKTDPPPKDWNGAYSMTSK
ncbi:MAG: CHASE2 domain-containing protein [Desulfobacterales bacterium]|nr:CHASE2 domain-containing protein [Desulfobacterales bacterium]